MGGLTAPERISVDPTPEAVQPLQRLTARFLENRLRNRLGLEPPPNIGPDRDRNARRRGTGGGGGAGQEGGGRDPTDTDEAGARATSFADFLGQFGQGQGSPGDPIVSGSRLDSAFNPQFINQQILGRGESGAGGPLDLPGMEGPLTQPLTQPQLDALQGFQQSFDPTQLVSSGQARGALSSLLSGDTSLSGGDFSRDVSQFDVGSQADPFFEQILGGEPDETSQAIAGLGRTFQEALAPRRFDLTETFQRGEQAFAGDLDRALAEVREEQSQFGLNPGAEDRSEALLRTAGDLSNRFRLGQLDRAQQAFESAEQRRLGALGLAPSVTAATQAPERLGVQALPSLLQREARPIESARFAQQLGQAGRLGALQQVPEFSAIPGQQAQQLFGLGEAARGVGDVDLQRRLQEFQRTQGAGLNQILGLISGSPLQQTQFGPSKLSQASQLGGNAALVAGAL